MNCRILYVLAVLIAAVSCDLLNTLKKKKVELPRCEVCKLLVDSFKKGIERTARGNFAGGDAAWEEEKLGSYYRSEVRLVEIQEKLCLDVEDGEAQCHSLSEDAELYYEDWWFNKQDTEPDLEKYLCITSMELCCEPGHYGPKCAECPGYPDDICSGNGKCEGSGLRTGTGKCICNKGYTGKMCKECAVNYFSNYDEVKKLSCSPCHISCQSGCTDGTPKGCKDCREGWLMDVEQGCLDIDECAILKHLCKDNQVCINTHGSFICQDKPQLGTADPGKWVRYMTYVGFLIATVVFFRKHVLLGTLIGIIAAIYVSSSEFIMNDYDVMKWDIRRLFNRS